MKLEDLQEELKQDLIIDSTKLQYESANNPVLYGKWLTKLSAIRKEMLRIEASKKSALKQKLDYYTGRGDGDEFSMDRYEKSEMKTVLSGTQFVAVGDAGTILTSPDGITWTARTSGTGNTLLWADLS